MDNFLSLATPAIAIGLAVGFRQVARRAVRKAFFQPFDEIQTGRACVIAYHSEVRAVGEAVLADGGNAVDAFIAAVAAENVMAEGASSLAGPLGALIYTPANGQVQYLDADFNDPLDPKHRYDPGKPQNGLSALVPGAPAGLEELAKRLGTIPLAVLLQPAILLAEEGFGVNDLMAKTIQQRLKLLKQFEYSKSVYLRNGKAPRVGDRIRQPLVADFLREYSQKGPAYVYSGAWSNEFVQAVRDNGGKLSSEDLSSYKIIWRKPWEMQLGVNRICTNSGRGYGGLWALLALKTLEHASLVADTHYASDPETLELLLRIAHETWAETWLLNPDALDDVQAIQQRLTGEFTREMFNRATSGANSPVPAPPVGTHSYQIITIDESGMIVTGTTTIESDSWGDGLFVHGVPLTNANRVPWSTKPGQRRLCPFSMHILFGPAGPSFVTGTISDSVVECSFQLLANYLFYGMDVDAILRAPRFGTFPVKSQNGRYEVDLEQNWLDPRISSGIVKELSKRGLKVQQNGVVDTGLGALAILQADRTSIGSTLPLPYVKDPFKIPPTD